MKKYLILLFCVFISGCAVMPSHDDYKKITAPSIESKTDKALVVFLRESGFIGGGATYYIYDGNEKIGVSMPGCYFHHYAALGEHTFWGETEAKKFITMNIESGKTYYIATSFGLGILVGVPQFTNITEVVALPLLKGIEYCELIKK
jgi:hypothetical protein